MISPMNAAQLVRAYVIESGGDGNQTPTALADQVLSLVVCPFMANGKGCPWSLEEIKEAAKMLKVFVARQNT